MYEEEVKNIVLSALIADSYSLGSHWIYDEKQLKVLKIDWNNLNQPCSIWHKDKKRGDFTHYGDQLFWLYEFLKDKSFFDEEEYLKYWQGKMLNYSGYIDKATSETLENIKKDIVPSGSSSTDLSVIGRIAPLLKVSKNAHEFLVNVEKYVRLTHNSSQLVNSALFFAKVFLKAFSEKNFEKIFLQLKDDFDTNIQEYITKGIASKNEDTFETIRKFGPACAVDEGFSGVIHLLCKYPNDIKTLLIENAKAGGDTSARAMLAVSLYMAQGNLNAFPKKWFELNVIL